MNDLTMLDLVRQRADQFERVAERARLAREARRQPRRFSRTQR